MNPRWEGAIVAIVMVVLLMVWLALASACTRPNPVVPVRVVDPIMVKVEPTALDCYLEDPPQPPPELPLNLNDDDVIRRVYIHKLEYNDAIVWMHAMSAWSADLLACLYRERVSP